MKGRPTCNDFLRAYADPDNPPSTEDLKRLFLTDEEEQAGYPAPASKCAWKWLVEWFGSTAILIVGLLLYLAGVVGYGIGYHEGPPEDAEDMRLSARLMRENASLRRLIEELEPTNLSLARGTVHPDTPLLTGGYFLTGEDPLRFLFRENKSLRKTIEELEFELVYPPRLLDEETVRIEELLCRHRYEENQVDTYIFEVLQLHCEQPQQGENRGRR